MGSTEGPQADTWERDCLLTCVLQQDLRGFSGVFSIRQNNFMFNQPKCDFLRYCQFTLFQLVPLIKSKFHGIAILHPSWIGNHCPSPGQSRKRCFLCSALPPQIRHNICKSWYVGSKAMHVTSDSWIIPKTKRTGCPWFTLWYCNLAIEITCLWIIYDLSIKNQGWPLPRLHMIIYVLPAVTSAISFVRAGVHRNFGRAVDPLRTTRQ